MGCNSIGNDGIEALTEGIINSITTSKLKWLGVGSNHITDVGAEKIADLLGAGWTNLDEDEGEESVRCPLTSVGLGGNDISSMGAGAIARALRNNDSKWSVWARGCKLIDPNNLVLCIVVSELSYLYHYMNNSF